MNNSEDLDARLAKSDPARRAVTQELSVGILTAATKSNPRSSLIERFVLLTARARSLALGGLVSGAAAMVAIAIVVNPTPQAIIQLAAFPTGAQNTSAMDSESSQDKMMSMAYLSYIYQAGDGLPNETGVGQVYKLVRTGEPETVLGALASVFGVQGSVKKYEDFSDLYPNYFFGESDDPWGMDNQNPMVSLYWSGTGSWNFYNPGDLSTSSIYCVEPDNEENCQEWTEVLPTPELLPARADAILQALEIFNATGLAVSESELRVDYSEWGVYISAALKVDGQPTSIEWYIGWSSTGEISYAGGHSVTAEPVGTFDTISAVQAIERLDDWRWYGSAATSFYDKYSNSSDLTTRSNQMIEPGFVDGEEQPLPEVVTLTIVGAEAVLVSIWDAAGDVWLVPGFILVNDQGWWHSVISLIEGVIALPEPSLVEIMPMPNS